MRIDRLEETDSTNSYVRRNGANEDVIAVAKLQTAGRGSKGRSFDSAEGGVYLSRLLHYADFPASEVFRIMVDASVAVCKTAEAFGLKPSIKWPNDVYLGGRKTCGILIENTFAGDRVSVSVVGIGVNVNNVLPEELREIATSFSAEAGRQLPLEEVTEALIANLQREYSLVEYRGYLSFLGRKVRLITSDGERIVTALGVDELGRLVTDGGTVTAGEVSLRL